MSDRITLTTGGIRVVLTFTPSDDERARFDQFAESTPGIAYHQLSVWADLAPRTVLQRYGFLWCEEAGEIRLSGIVRLTRLLPGRTLASFPRGPLFGSVDDFERCLPAVFAALRRAGACTLLANPQWHGQAGQDVLAVMSRFGFRRLPPKWRAFHAATGFIDLTRPEDAILAGFEKRCRKDLRKAERSGMSVREVRNETEASRLDQVYYAFAEGKQLDIAGGADCRTIWRMIERGQPGAVIQIEADGEIIGGTGILIEGGRAYPPIVFTLPSATNLPRSHLLLWESMRLMKARGCTLFDMGGLPEDKPGDEGEERRKSARG